MPYATCRCFIKKVRVIYAGSRYYCRHILRQLAGQRTYYAERLFDTQNLPYLLFTHLPRSVRWLCVVFDATIDTPE